MTRAHVGAGLGIEQHVALERGKRIDDDGKRVVVDGDELGGVDARGARLAQDDRHDVADEANGAVGEVRTSHPLVETRDRRWLERAEVQVGGGEDLDAGER